MSRPGPCTTTAKCSAHRAGIEVGDPHPGVPHLNNKRSPLRFEGFLFLGRELGDADARGRPEEGEEDGDPVGDRPGQVGQGGDAQGAGQQVPLRAVRPPAGDRLVKRRSRPPPGPPRSGQPPASPPPGRRTRRGRGPPPRPPGCPRPGPAPLSSAPRRRP